MTNFLCKLRKLRSWVANFLLVVLFSFIVLIILFVFSELFMRILINIPEFLGIELMILKM